MENDRIRARKMYHRFTEEDKIIAGPPVDFSYRKITKIADLQDQNPHSIRTGKLPERSATHFLSASLWLNNNSLSSLSHLSTFSRTIIDPLQLSWLDVSYNKLPEIEDSITHFPNLKILYLHGNQISEITNALKLKKLKNLRSLTLHGNPIDKTSDYRNFIIAILPQISQLDFSLVTNNERKKPLPTNFFKIFDGLDK